MSFARLANVVARSARPTCTVPAIGDVPGTVRFARRTAGKISTSRSNGWTNCRLWHHPLGLRSLCRTSLNRLRTCCILTVVCQYQNFEKERAFIEPDFKETEIQLASKAPDHTKWPLPDTGPKQFGEFTHARSYWDTDPTPRHPRDPGFTEPEYSGTVIHGRAFYPPIYHPKTHGVPVATIHFRSYETNLMDRFLHFVAHAAAALAIPISKPAHLPKQRSLWTVLRGPFAHKKSQENFERIVHKRAIKAWDADPVVIDRWIRYLSKHAMPGTGMRVIRWTRMPVGVGAQVAGNVDRQIGDKVKALGEKIVLQELAALERAKKSPLKTSNNIAPTYNLV